MLARSVVRTSSGSICSSLASAVSARYRRFWKYSRSLSLKTRPLWRQRKPNQPPASPRPTPSVTIKTVIPVPKASITSSSQAESVLNQPQSTVFGRFALRPRCRPPKNRARQLCFKHAFHSTFFCPLAVRHGRAWPNGGLAHLPARLRPHRRRPGITAHAVHQRLGASLEACPASRLARRGQVGRLQQGVRHEVAADF